MYVDRRQLQFPSVDEVQDKFERLRSDSGKENLLHPVTISSFLLPPVSLSPVTLLVARGEHRLEVGAHSSQGHAMGLESERDDKLESRQNLKNLKNPLVPFDTLIGFGYKWIQICFHERKYETGKSSQNKIIL